MSEIELTELIAQAYTGNGCKISAGTVEGHPVDTVYLRLEKDGEEATTLLLRPDELAAIAWCASGVLWSVEMQRMDGQEAK